MTPGARIKAAIDICLEIETGTSPADVILDSYFRGRRYVGARDRRYITTRVYSVLRLRTGLDWWITRIDEREPTSKRLDKMSRMRARMIADLALNEATPATHMSEIFNGANHCPDLLTAHERALAEELEGQPFASEDMPDWVRHEFPEWMDGMLRELWEDDLGRQLDALNGTAPVDLRVNLVKASRDEAKSRLAGEGVFSDTTPLSPMGLRLEGRTRLGGLLAFRDGLVEVQDEGSQVVSLLADARPGMTVVDFCAGGGGKTLAMAAAMTEDGGGTRRVRGRIFACDVSSRRLRRMEDRLQRAGVADAVIPRTLISEHDRWVETSRDIADRVFLDVPCSGTGTWRRSPDSKWRLTPAELNDLHGRQRAILGSAHRLVRRGGRMIYATCSVLPHENEDQVAWFLAGHPGFRLIPVSEIWGETVGGPCPANAPWLSLTPADHGTDGFFCAVLERCA